MREFFESLGPGGQVGSAFLAGVAGGVVFVLLKVYVLNKVEPLIGITPAVAL